MLLLSTCLWQKGFNSHLREISLYPGTWPFQLFTLMAWLEMHLFFLSNIGLLQDARILSCTIFFRITSLLRNNVPPTSQVRLRLLSASFTKNGIVCRKLKAPSCLPYLACECGEGIPTPELLCPGSSPGRSSLSRTSAPTPRQPCAVSLLLHPPCVRPQEATRGWPSSVLITLGLRGGGLHQPLHQLNCSVVWASSTLGTLLKMQSLSFHTFLFLEDPS